jgi:hypothetical protein
MPSRFACNDRLGRRLRFALAAGAFVGLLFGCRTTTPAGSTLVIQTPKADTDADVFVDGTYVGRVGALGAGKLPPIRLAPGVHRVEVRKTGRFPVQRTIRVETPAPAEVVLDAQLLEDPR